VLDMKVNGSGVPAGAVAMLATCLIVDAVAGSGNCTIWAAGVATPTANSLVWGGTAGRASSLVVSALDATAHVQVEASIKTDVVLDVIGYYL
jgi:hypothetical protein